ncbi:hypothetical protein [Actinoplanes sp. CA-252034]|uniref:hypothetical protein n=1 Tax=Actinoplanes sp. CA-252034 TaxID=3239906 RepID=UPI003D95973E
MTKEPTKDPTDQPSETPAEEVAHLPRHPAARPRGIAEADRELVPPDADLGEPTGKDPTIRR